METAWRPLPRRWSCRHFNGATALRRWKRADSGGHYPMGPHTSMEPPPFGDGNRLPRWSCPFPIRRLQWSHRPSAMETGPHDYRRGLGGHTSMEPPPFGDGNVEEHGQRAFRKVTSMEPPPSGDGNWNGEGCHQLPCHTSMEPPPSGDGNPHGPGHSLPGPQTSMEPPPSGDGNCYLCLNLDFIPAVQCGFRYIRR